MQIKAHFREGRKSPWEARWWVNQKMRTRFFETEKERDQFIREFQNDIKREGSKVFNFEAKKVRRWQIVDEMLPDVDPVDLAEFWIINPKFKQVTSIAIGIAIAIGSRTV